MATTTTQKKCHLKILHTNGLRVLKITLLMVPMQDINRFWKAEYENNTIYMKATTGAYLLNMEDTIAQALEEALLPRSPRNLDVVNRIY